MLKVMFSKKRSYVNFINSFLNFKFNLDNNIYIVNNKIIKITKRKVLIFLFTNVFKISSLFKKDAFKYVKYRHIYFSKLYITGLGFKLFYFNSFLYLLLGYSHYILLPTIPEIKIYCFKKRLYIFSCSKYHLLNFLNIIRMCKTLNVFKHKGLFEFKQYKHIIKVKAGKKKQFM